MSFRLNISPAVKQELAEAYGWYAERNKKTAGAFQDEVLGAFDLIAQTLTTIGAALVIG